MIRELKTFIAVARDGTFAAAGDRIGLTQAAVSAQMQRLESELGFQLFARTGRSARINAMGERTLSQAQHLIRLYDNLGSVDEDGSAFRIVRVGAIASVQKWLLPNALARFHKAMPECRTHVIPGVSMQLLDRMDAGEIDLAAIIRPHFPLPRELRWTTLAHEPFRLLVPKRVPGDDWADLLATHAFLRYDRSSLGGRLVERFLRARGLKVRDLCEMDELEAIVALVAKGVGVALVPETSAQGRWPAGVRALDLGRHTFYRDIGLVHRAKSSLDGPAQALGQAVCRAYGVGLE